MDADWDFSLLEELIQDRGDQFILETAVACTCRREDAITSFSDEDGHATRQRKLNCDQCHGDGFLYRNARFVKGLVTGINPGNRSLIDAGHLLPGDCVFSPSLDIGYITDFDKITFTFAEPFGEGQIIQRNAANLSERKLVKNTLETNQDRLWYSAACSIWCEDENSVVYNEGTDFELCENAITWIGNKPNDGTFYSLKYSAFFEWIAYQTPMGRVDNGRDLAQRVVLRKKHVAFMDSTDKATPSQRQANELALTGRIKI